MGKKFLHTRRSRELLVMTLKIFVGLALAALIAVIAFSAPLVLFLEPSQRTEHLLSLDWWVVVAQVIVSLVIGAAGVLVMLVGLAILFALVLGVCYLLLGTASGKTITLRDRLSWYNTFIENIGAVYLPNVTRFLSWPFRKLSSAVKGWVARGEPAVQPNTRTYPDGYYGGDDEAEEGEEE